jgi:hypothetical protein
VSGQASRLRDLESAQASAAVEYKRHRARVRLQRAITALTQARARTLAHMARTAAHTARTAHAQALHAYTAYTAAHTQPLQNHLTRNTAALTRARDKAALHNNTLKDISTAVLTLGKQIEHKVTTTTTTK